MAANKNPTCGETKFSTLSPPFEILHVLGQAWKL